MHVSIEPASEETHRQLVTWRYPPPYDFYDGDVDPVLNPERYFEARDEQGELIGFLLLGRSRRTSITGWVCDDLVGRGLGLDFFLAGLAFARQRYQPRRVFLHVAEFNDGARRVYERAGFRVVSSHVRTFERFGEVPFLTMADTPEA